MYADHQRTTLTSFRAGLTMVVAPLQYVIDLPFRLLSIAKSNLYTYRSLVTENAALKTQQLFLQAQLQKFKALETENANLRALLKSLPKENEKISRIEVGRLLAINPGSYAQEVILDKGSRVGVYVGQPVLDANGIVGQVIGVGLMTSRVLLLTDNRSAIPIENSSNGARAIAVGQGGSGELMLIHLSDISAFKAGDLLVSSGLGGNYPRGYIVGVVKQIQLPKNEIYSRIMVAPAAHLDRNQQMLLLWPTQKDIFIDVPPEPVPRKASKHKITEDVR
jgi:rod shape-determining protein MreC